MSETKHWPYRPICLSDIIPEKDLQVLQSGCCDRLERPLTLLDRDPISGDFTRRINPLDEVDHYEPFCRLLRDTSRVEGGNVACLQCDLREARRSLTYFLDAPSGEKQNRLSRVFKCHMGLQDLTYLICISDMPVAIIFSGQYCPGEGFAEIRDRVQRLGTSEYEGFGLPVVEGMGCRS